MRATYNVPWPVLILGGIAMMAGAVIAVLVAIVGAVLAVLIWMVRGVWKGAVRRWYAAQARR